MFLIVDMKILSACAALRPIPCNAQLMHGKSITDDIYNLSLLSCMRIMNSFSLREAIFRTSPILQIAECATI